MGTTLSNGVYLPDEGERNCYAGLKLNWETLDQKVADISALQSAIAGALHREIVASLPTTDIDTATIYMILNGTSATENVYDEYMYINNAWELIGTSATDLTNYYTKADVDGKLLLKANASDLTSHTGDTTIHVTASDKAKWNTVALIKQLRLVNTQVGSATTIAFANIDDTNGIKVGDKCMDLDAKMFEITAVDSANETVTVGSALIDLAQDSDVVHKSGNEAISGAKTFNDKLTMLNAVRGLDLTSQTVDANDLTSNASGDIKLYRCTSISGAVNITNIPVQTAFVLIVMQIKYTGVADSRTIQIFYDVASSSVVNVYTRIQYNGTWSNWVKDTDKFVTTDTSQTISGTKVLSSTPSVYNSDISGSTANLYLRNQLVSKGDTSTSGNQTIRFSDTSDKILGRIQSTKVTNGNTTLNLRADTIDSNNADVTSEVQVIAQKDGNKSFSPQTDNAVDLGRNLAKWRNVLVNQINGLNPGALWMPADTFIDISAYITDLSGGSNQYQAPSDGIITLDISGTNRYVLYNNNLAIGDRLSGSNFRRASIIPVRKNDTVIIQSDGGTLNYAKFYPCQGNV